MPNIRYFKAGQDALWDGVIEAIPQPDGEYRCIQYGHWPDRSPAYLPFPATAYELDEAVRSRNWQEAIVDPDLLLDEGI